MPQSMQNILQQYVREVVQLYGSHLKRIILYGSYARGDFRADSDVDIMILLDIPDIEAKTFFDRLIDITFDYNMEHDLDIKPAVKNEKHFQKWVAEYPFYANVNSEGVDLYVAA